MLTYMFASRHFYCHSTLDPSGRDVCLLLLFSLEGGKQCPLTFDFAFPDYQGYVHLFIPMRHFSLAVSKGGPSEVPWSQHAKPFFSWITSVLQQKSRVMMGEGLHPVSGLFTQTSTSNNSLKNKPRVRPMQRTEMPVL